MKGINIIWFICCEFLFIGCALLLELIPMIIFFTLGIAPSVVSYLKERQRTKQVKYIEDAEIERKKMEFETRIKEMEIYRDIVLELATISPPKSEELEKHNHDNLFYFEDTAKKRATKIISERENNADRSLPAYFKNLKKDISDDTNGFIDKSMLQNLLKKDDNNET